jgi:hypothetical protein
VGASASNDGDLSMTRDKKYPSSTPVDPAS